MSDKIPAFDPSRDKYKPKSDPGEGDDTPCVKCGLAWLDTGLECTNCGHDNYEAIMGKPFPGNQSIMTIEHEEAVRLAKQFGNYYGNDDPNVCAFTEAQLAALIAEVRRNDRAKVDMIEMPTPDDIKGRFQSELFWRGAYAMRDAIRARLEEGK